MCRTLIKCVFLYVKGIICVQAACPWNETKEIAQEMCGAQSAPPNGTNHLLAETIKYYCPWLSMNSITKKKCSLHQVLETKKNILNWLDKIPTHNIFLKLEKRQSNWKKWTHQIIVNCWVPCCIVDEKSQCWDYQITKKKKLSMDVSVRKFWWSSECPVLMI